MYIQFSPAWMNFCGNEREGGGRERLFLAPAQNAGIFRSLEAAAKAVQDETEKENRKHRKFENYAQCIYG